MAEITIEKGNTQSKPIKSVNKIKGIRKMIKTIFNCKYFSLYPFIIFQLFCTASHASIEVSSAIIKKVIANGNEAIIQGNIKEKQKLITQNKINIIGSIKPNSKDNNLKGVKSASQSVLLVNAS